jgi:hypothetical protein
MVSVGKMPTVLEEYTTEDYRSLVFFFSLWEKGLNSKDIYKEMFPVYGGKRVSRKAVHTAGSRNLENVSLMAKRLK